MCALKWWFASLSYSNRLSSKWLSSSKRHLLVYPLLHLKCFALVKLNDLDFHDNEISFVLYIWLEVYQGLRYLLSKFSNYYFLVCVRMVAQAMAVFSIIYYLFVESFGDFFCFTACVVTHIIVADLIWVVALIDIFTHPILTQHWRVSTDKKCILHDFLLGRWTLRQVKWQVSLNVRFCYCGFVSLWWRLQM